MFKILSINLFLFFLSSVYTEDTKFFKERVLLEDFESTKLSIQSFRIQANTNYLPDIRMSKNLTSPDLVSNTSLLVRIPSSGLGIPMDLLFPKPYTIEDYLIEIEFHVYSNQANGELFLYLLDSRFQKHKIFIASLNYNGWKSFVIPIGNRINQSDFILAQPSFIRISGIQFNPQKKETKDKEDLIAIDDIFITKRKKYKLPEKGLEGFR